MLNVATHLMSTMFAGPFWGRSLVISLLLITVLCLLPGAATAQEDDVCTYYNQSPDTYLAFDSDRHIDGTINWYTDGNCMTAGGEWEVPADGWVLAQDNTEETAIELCKAALGGSINVIRQFDIYPSPFSTFNTQVYQCHKTKTSNAPKKRKGMTRPVVYTGVLLNKETGLQLSAVNGLYSGIQFQRVSPAGVGKQSVLDLGYLDAVDVWAIIGDGYEVCFPQPGQIIFLDAATAPRTVTTIEYFTRDGYTCAFMDRAGTMVLVQAPQPL